MGETRHHALRAKSCERIAEPYDARRTCIVKHHGIAAPQRAAPRTIRAVTQEVKEPHGKTPVSILAAKML